jgi:RNA polymerase sigma-70 factor (ECF subfamily)
MSVDFAVEASIVHGRGERQTARRSDLGRFEDIIRRHHAALRRVAAGVLVDADALDDVLQEAYLKAYKSLPRTFANAAHEAAWLHRVVYRTCVDELRRRQRRRSRELQLTEELPERRDASVRLDVRQGLRALDPQDRAVVLLVDLLGFDYETAARVTGVPRGTLAWRLSVARERFRAAIDEGGSEIE